MPFLPLGASGHQVPQRSEQPVPGSGRASDQHDSPAEQRATKDLGVERGCSQIDARNPLAAGDTDRFIAQVVVVGRATSVRG